MTACTCRRIKSNFCCLKRLCGLVWPERLRFKEDDKSRVFYPGEGGEENSASNVSVILSVCILRWQERKGTDYWFGNKGRVDLEDSAFVIEENVQHTGMKWKWGALSGIHLMCEWEESFKEHGSIRLRKRFKALEADHANASRHWAGGLDRCSSKGSASGFT